MKKTILLLTVILCFTGCAANQKFLIEPVKFENGITDKEILSYAGDLKIMCAKIFYGGSALRYASTGVGRSAGIAAGLLGVGGGVSRSVIGLLSLASGASYEAQGIFDTKGKATICAYGLRRIEKAELKYARELLRSGTVKIYRQDEEMELAKTFKNVILTEAGLKLYENIINIKEVMVKMFMGQVPERGEL